MATSSDPTNNAPSRLRNIAAHVDDIARMAEEGTHCTGLIRQIQAAQVRLSKVSALLLNSHLHACVTTAISDDHPMQRERVLGEIQQVFAAINRR